jgi:hypothetical protein
MRRLEFVALLGGATLTPVVAVAQQPAPPPAASPLWDSYGGAEAIILAIALLAVAGGFAYAGKRLRTPLKITGPGGVAAAFMIVVLLLAIHTLAVAAAVYGQQIKQVYPGFVRPRVHVGTFAYAAVTFLVILYLTRRWGWKIALASAIIGTAAAPMIFELPFDLRAPIRRSRGIRCCFGSCFSCRCSSSNSRRYRC